MIYFAIFHKNKENQFEVNFPDLAPAAATFGNTLVDAITNAHDSLTGYLLTAEDFNEQVPSPTEDPFLLKVNEPDFLMPIKVNLELERAKEQNKLIKKTLTIPEYLDIQAKEAKINLSKLLTEALEKKLNI
ncbi:type II toxin-antitoxin system HicB family antitoxin [Lactobacillus jensenii]|uniref:type II toxin-antitoxin system HicB family antitoxin n=1 Tax=Lactobacillus jensenii TaxID=109790 RepID=UPI0001B9614D|nr:type II toxin-antitoxin system HicB family antitoxin [Lactobacillus jensenii]DAK37229.1 MAG TPA: putative nuclease [Caudoviricetes sp.]EEX26672.1 putative toxin-antitoxin system, antitoxin component, HicB family [Lactobacillus jensenii SJ-7A-US]MBS5831774.1 type II toxin-antitoxin system HicB family antitoxin [Lactobacillus jensenii]MCW8081986.1 type II toxin-antitoxin system HicB family antitoxin [Lactobacillus jensenii]MCZ3724062.1 type II toxin-antitoxin system HicB family antitoxin [Lac